jgi:hypothetical protein
MTQHLRTAHFVALERWTQCRDDGDSKLLRNVGQYLPVYMAQHSRRQPSSVPCEHVTRIAEYAAVINFVAQWKKKNLSWRNAFTAHLEA